MPLQNRKIAYIGAADLRDSIQSQLADMELVEPGADARLIVVKIDDVRSFQAQLPVLVRSASEAVLLVVSANDIDTHLVRTSTGLPRSRVIGLGTLPMTLRLATGIARRLRVSVRDVHAHVVGGLPDAPVPLWSSSSVAGIPLHKWAVPGHRRLSVFDRTELFQEARRDLPTTDPSVVDAILAIIRAVIDDTHRVLPVSTLIESRPGLEGVTLSLPCIISAKGAEPPLDVPLNDAEQAGLLRASELAREALARATARPA
jgi:L-lactate dehydrogenase